MLSAVIALFQCFRGFYIFRISLTLISRKSVKEQNGHARKIIDRKTHCKRFKRQPFQAFPAYKETHSPTAGWVCGGAPRGVQPSSGFRTPWQIFIRKCNRHGLLPFCRIARGPTRRIVEATTITIMNPLWKCLNTCGLQRRRAKIFSSPFNAKT